MVITTIGLLRELTLAVDCTSKFTPPDHEGIVEHTALLQVKHQCCTGSIGMPAELGELNR